MRYIERNNKIYAYKSGVTVVFQNNKWELSSIAIMDLERFPDTVQLTEKEAMIITAGNSPEEIISQYLDYLNSIDMDKK